jgi:flagellar basal-body rod modification protein FlgD
MDPTLAPTPAPTPAPTAPAPAPAAPAPASGGTITSDFDTFLKMLTVQMQNQDPLDPIDSADYAVQLATFSGVEQQVMTNELLAGLSGQMALSGLADMASWVGNEARAPMPVRFDGAPVTISPNPVAMADKVELVVKDGTGKEISRVGIPNSADPIEWAGVTADGAPLPPGTYSFAVESWSGTELLLSEPAEVYGTVTEVRSVDGQTALVMEGGILVPASSVTALRTAT